MIASRQADGADGTVVEAPRLGSYNVHPGPLPAYAGLDIPGTGYVLLRISKVIEADPEARRAELVDDYIYKHHFKMYPVVEGERLVGCVTTNEIKQLPRDEWDRQTVGSIAKQCDMTNTIAPDADAMQALARMGRTKLSRLLVVEGEHLAGVITLKDLLHFLTAKIELEDEAKA